MSATGQALLYQVQNSARLGLRSKADLWSAVHSRKRLKCTDFLFHAYPGVRGDLYELRKEGRICVWETPVGNLAQATKRENEQGGFDVCVDVLGSFFELPDSVVLPPPSSVGPFKPKWNTILHY